MNGMWKCVEGMLDLGAVAARWRRMVGDEFETWRAVMLQKAADEAMSVPCPACTHGSLEVMRYEGKIYGVPDCNFTGCKEVTLTETDLVVWEWNWNKVSRGLAKALGCEAKLVNLGPGYTWQVAEFGASRLPVVVTIQLEPEDFRGAVAELVARMRSGFVLLAPTGMHHDARIQELLGSVKAGFFDLESNVTLLPNGEMQAQKPVREFISAHRPEMERASVPLVYQKTGQTWKVVFDGMPEIHVEDTFGARYLDYLLHHPNEPIAAYDLEIKIRPEKAAVRARNSVQMNLDPATIRNCLREIEKLRAQRDAASDEGRLEAVDSLDEEIASIESVLKKKGGAADNGERARGNVSKAIAAVHQKLIAGDKHEKAFGLHLKECVSTGYHFRYSHPGGGCWQ